MRAGITSLVLHPTRLVFPTVTSRLVLQHRGWSWQAANVLIKGASLAGKDATTRPIASKSTGLFKCLVIDSSYG